MTLFSPPQQIASSKSTEGSKNNFPSSSGKQILNKKPIYCFCLDRNHIHYFRDSRERVRIGVCVCVWGEVIHFNRAVSVLLATLPLCTFLVLYKNTTCGQDVCVCQHNTVNNKGATVVIGVGKSWNSFEGERIFIHFNDQALYWLFRKSNIQPARQRESFSLRCNFTMVSGTISIYNPQTDITPRRTGRHLRGHICADKRCIVRVHQNLYDSSWFKLMHF